MSDERRKVFLSYAVANREMAELVAEVFTQHGYTVFFSRISTTGASALEGLRETMFKSDLIVVLLTASALKSALTTFEVGMAQAWAKPVYVLFEGISPDEVPVYLRRFPVYGISQVDELLRELHDATTATSA